ncbi:MAG: hypothetical protein LJE92_02310 [Gammaproteobacteria bacterium]|jgi:hypothetical protein|nr:hypothetical protein [Gammaproteobacteria bacterium]
MTEKQEIIKQMLDLQHKFIELEQRGEFSTAEYYDSEGDTELARHKRSFEELSTKLVDLAHADKGSKR